VKQLIFSPGLSTADHVTDISGRGVGLDVVKTNIERIGGSVEIESRVGQGTTLRVKIPLTLAIIPALIVVAGDERYAIPQVSVREIVTFQPQGSGRAVETIGNARVYRLRGELLPLVDLHDALHVPKSATDAGEFANIVVLQAVGQRCGLVVDHVKNTEEIVVKPLHKTLARLSVFSGATIMGDGRVALILDVAGLTRVAGVVQRGQDTAGQSAIEADDAEAMDSHGADDLLLCLVGRDRHVAVPLPDVARLEEIPVAAIQSSAGQPVIAYRSHIMPLLSLDRAGNPAAGEDGRVSVVVHAVGRRYVGLCVDRIVDIVEATQELDTSQRQPAIRGRMLIRGHVVDIIDIRELARTCGVSLPAERIAGGTR
jgi:two-component system chemotaxis sensor kinase CheA